MHPTVNREQASKWWPYVIKVAGESSQLSIATKAGINPSNITRWKNGCRPAADIAVAFARAYRRPVLEALVASGYITEDEAELREVPATVGQLSDIELLQGLLAKAAQREGSSDGLD